ncbi:MAG: RnfABCDGE type electron transport complex subunit B [Cyclobacteriaceae bacterium]|nr:RnfABCDGE type electron transport complex subunit B [Cyclobacteriaceae bacterium HetDA_MAG_MS6]
MSDVVIYTLLVLVTLGIIAAVILFWVSRRFSVEEDPRREQLMDALPNTNCGGCGFPGCGGFANALLQADDLKPYHCPVGGNEVMKEVSKILGKEVEEKDPFVAIVRCTGSFESRKQTNVYDGAANCTIASELYSGDHGCAYGCVGLGECVDACDFDAMYMDKQTGLPVIIEDKCTACNACVTACPKDIIELWPVGRKHQRIYVACKNEEKSGVARQECAVACTGCAKCFDECTYDAIVVENNLATIDFEKCTLCAKCVIVCDSRSIEADNVPEKSLTKLMDIRAKKLEREKAKRLEEKNSNNEQIKSVSEPPKISRDAI